MKIIIKNLQKRIPIYPKRIKRAALNTFLEEGIKKSGEITVCLTNDKYIKELNLFYLGRYDTTDVISFEIINTQKLLTADIAISTDAAIRNARIFKTSAGYELYLYLVHGIMHLLGYDDNTLRKRELMQKRVEIILSKLKIKP